jgi:subtilisin-like proprotein convertase family protein/subtilisin family serine protease
MPREEQEDAMPGSSTPYTYRAGKKVALTKSPDQFVVRARPEKLRDLGMPNVERVSPASSRVTAPPAELEVQMTRARGIAPTHHAYYRADTGEEFLVTDRILVTFKAAMTPGAVADFAGRYGLILKQAYSNREYLFELTDHTGMNPVKLVVALNEREPGVESAEHDLNRRASKYESIPPDPAYVRQWHLHERLADPAFDRRASSHCEGAWTLLGGFGSTDVVVGVTDDGCRLDHADFDSPGKFPTWAYFQGTRMVTSVDIDASPARMYQAGANHGTACAGVIAAEADAVLTVGAAPGCRVLPIKWESDGPSLLISDSKMLTMLDWIADRVDVLSNSWGSVPDNTWAQPVVNRIAELARTGGRRGRGILFLWAAGNENCPIQHSTSIDVPYTRGWQVRSDGSRVWVGVRTARVFENNLVGIPGVLHVAALASNARRSHYSNYGTGIGICAPTSNVHEYLRLPVEGLPITTTTGAPGGVTPEFGGTSSATPLVAGVAALVISANPDLSASDVVAILQRTASRDLSLEGYPATPPASFDPTPAWDVSPIAPFASGTFVDSAESGGSWSPWFGHGRVDATAAVAEARRLGGTGSGVTVRQSSSPRQRIPDHDAAGLADVLRIAETGRVTEVRVAVDITHSWIGDLRVSLTAPDQTTVTLHERAGGSAHDLRKEYVPSTLPALESLTNHEVHGAWPLRVQDLASADTGILNSWSLQIHVAPGPATAEDSESVRIPDNDALGIVRKLELPEAGTIRDVSVSVDITHAWIGDLRITLTPPEGSPIRLFDQAGGDADNLLRTWRSQELDALRVLRGQSGRGTWQLQVADLAADDEGKLNRWAIEVTE